MTDAEREIWRMVYANTFASAIGAGTHSSASAAALAIGAANDSIRGLRVMQAKNPDFGVKV